MGDKTAFTQQVWDWQGAADLTESEMEKLIDTAFEIYVQFQVERWPEPDCFYSYESDSAIPYNRKEYEKTQERWGLEAIEKASKELFGHKTMRLDTRHDNRKELC